MLFSLTQLFLTLFLLFALTRVVLRFRGGAVSVFGFFFWIIIFGLGTIAVLKPDLTSNFANTLGIGRGVDAVLYISIVLLFYLLFRLHIFLEDIKREISSLIRELALRELDEKQTRKTS